MSEYGSLNLRTHEEDEHKVRGFKRTVALAVFAVTVAAGLIAATVVTATSGSSASVVDANRNKGQLAAVPGVMEKTQEVLNMTTYGLRYAVFSFTPCCESDCGECKIVPTVQGAASDDWASDWTSFTNALPENSVAAAVYNFEYFTGESATANKPILITWAPPNTDDKQLARAGYYLGSVILATEGVHEHYPLKEMGEGYMSFCADVLDIDRDLCSMEGDFHNCPFENDAGLGPTANPCEAVECDGAAFSNPDVAADEGMIPEECCQYIEDYCRDPANVGESPGCFPVTLRSITRLCAFQQPDETPDLILPEDEEQPCDASACMQPCAFFEDENDTWKKCSGCRTDKLKDPETGLVYQCYPGAIGFEMNRCCGIAAECGAAESQTGLACDTLEEFNCVWLEHRDCPEELYQQNYDAAPLGCCAGAEGVNQMDCDGDFVEGDCPAPATDAPVVEASEAPAEGR